MSAEVDTGDRVWRFCLGYLVISGVLLVAYYWLSPVAQDVLFDLVGFGAIIVIGRRALLGRRHLSDPRPWLLLGLGLAAFFIADLVWDFYTYALHVETPFPSVADAFYLGAYPFLVAGLATFARRQTPGRDWSNLLDAAIVATGLGLITWVYLVEPLARRPELSGLGKAISASYPLMDVLVVWVFAELIFAGGMRTAARRLLALSLGCMLIADVAYALTLLAGTYADGSAIDAGWLVSYMALAAAAAHPSSAEAPGRPVSAPAPLTRGRLVSLCGAALLGLVVLAVENARDRDVDVGVVAVGSALLFALVVARLAGMTKALARARDRLEGALARERVLHEAGELLVGATDGASIERAAVQASLRLLPECDEASVTVCRSGDPWVSVPRNGDQSARLVVPLGGPGADDVMIVATRLSLPPETQAALEAMGSQVGLALKRAALAEELVEQAAAHERVRMAREIHDVVSHGLSVIVMTAAGCRRAARADAGRALQGLEAIEARGREAMGEMRRLVCLLRDRDDDPDRIPRPGLRSLGGLVQSVRDAGLEVDCTIEVDAGAVAPSVDMCAYRIVQESLTNSLQHAGRGTHVAVAVRHLGQFLEITVEDEGPSGGPPGPAVAAPANGHARLGRGLVGMQERASLLGGELVTGPRPGGGYLIRSRLPLWPDRP